MNPPSLQKVTYPLPPLELARALASVLTVCLHLRHEIHACLHVCLAPSLTAVTLCRWRCRPSVPCPGGGHRAVFGVCFHCLRVGLSRGPRRGDGGAAAAAVAQRWAAGSGRDSQLRQGWGVERGGRCCGGRAAGGPARTTGAQLPSEGRGSTPPPSVPTPWAHYSAPQGHLCWPSFPKMGRHQEVCVREVPGSPLPGMEVRRQHRGLWLSPHRPWK